MNSQLLVKNHLNSTTKQAQLRMKAQADNHCRDVSLLKAHQGLSPQHSLQLPPEVLDHRLVILPLVIVDHSLNHDGEIEALVQWDGLPPEDAMVTLATIVA